MLATKKSYVPVLNTLPNESIRINLYDQFEKNTAWTGADRWQQIAAACEPNTHAASHVSKKIKINYAELESWRYELVFTHCYPRLDANVSKTQNHLLKSPFCVHPKTGRVCIPIDPEDADNFDPFTVPTVRSLCSEIDSHDSNAMDVASESMESKSSPSSSSIKSDVDKTSLKEAMEMFERTFMKSMWASIRRDHREKSDRMAALNADF